MHQDILPFHEMLYILPCKQFVFRQCMAVTHYLIVLFPLFFIDKIADQHIQHIPGTGKITQCFQYFQISVLPHPVIAVHHFKIKAFCLPDTCIDCRPVSAVCLIDQPYYIRILLLILPADPGRFVHGAVIDYQNLHVLSAGQQRLDAFSHICRRIITGNRHR